MAFSYWRLISAALYIPKYIWYTVPIAQLGDNSIRNTLMDYLIPLNLGIWLCKKIHCNAQWIWLYMQIRRKECTRHTLKALIWI